MADIKTKNAMPKDVSSHNTAAYSPEQKAAALKKEDSHTGNLSGKPVIPTETPLPDEPMTSSGATAFSDTMTSSDDTAPPERIRTHSENIIRQKPDSPAVYDDIQTPDTPVIHETIRQHEPIIAEHDYIRQTPDMPVLQTTARTVQNPLPETTPSPRVTQRTVRTKDSVSSDAPTEVSQHNSAAYSSEQKAAALKKEDSHTGNLSGKPVIPSETPLPDEPMTSSGTAVVSEVMITPDDTAERIRTREKIAPKTRANDIKTKDSADVKNIRIKENHSDSERSAQSTSLPTGNAKEKPAETKKSGRALKSVAAVKGTAGAAQRLVGSLNVYGQTGESETEYAASKAQSEMENLGRKGTRFTEKALDESRNVIQRAQRNAKQIRKAEKETIKTVEKSAKTAVKTAEHSVKTAEKTAKAAEKTVKTAEQAGKAAVKTAEQAAKAAEKAAQASAKAAQKAAQTAQTAARAVAHGVKVAAQATAEAVKAVVAGIKSLSAALVAGGSVSLAIIAVICIVAILAGSVYGIFFTEDALQDTITEIEQEYNEKITSISNSNPHEVLDMHGDHPPWKVILTVFSVKLNGDPNNPQDIADLNYQKRELLREVFWDMTVIDYFPVVQNDTVIVDSDDGHGHMIQTESVQQRVHLFISVTATSPELASLMYDFTSEQVNMLNDLLYGDATLPWDDVLHGIDSNDQIVEVAASQIGNINGDPYWSWYGFTSRVSWCACFVSWCADQCGYIERGVFPKFAGVIQGEQYFKERGLWRNGSETPEPGMLIFFDWTSAHDGLPDHVGIVEKVQNGYVHTIEGNCGNAVRRQAYPLGDSQIYGYAAPEY